MSRTNKDRAALIGQIEATRKEKGVTVAEACAKAGISTVTYYQWKKKLLKGELSDNESSPELVPKPASKIGEEEGNKILEIKACFPHMGVKQLRQYMIRNHKIHHSERQVRQFLEYHGVPKLKSAFPPQPVRRFERDLPNEMWQTDIMTFHVGTTPLHLISFLDDYSRFIVSFSVSENQTSEAILSLLRRTISFRKPLSILTDRGIQFCSWNGIAAFQLELKYHRIDHLQAREQHPQTLGKIEAFHKTIKRELLTTTEFGGVGEAKERIHDYIMFYNFARPHMGIGDKSPAERYFKKLRPYNPDAIYYRQVKGQYLGNKNGRRYNAKNIRPARGTQSSENKESQAPVG